jgi:hypothetical protein
MRPSPAVLYDEPAESTIEEQEAWSGPKSNDSLVVANAWQVWIKRDVYGAAIPKRPTNPCP